MTNYFKTVNINTATSKSSGTSVLVIYTGGTIGMDYDEKSGGLIPFDFEKIMDKVPELKRFNFGLTVLSFFNLLDSSDIKTRHWASLVRIISDFYQEYDGFVILHGTDTMAYSASALSFMLENLGKPVIFTGAQLPIGASRTDARENLISALEIASTKKKGKALIPEVCIYFDHRLLRGNRAKKVQNFNFTAFESHNYPPLAVAGIHIDYHFSYMLKHPGKSPVFHFDMDDRVVILKLFPGMTPAYINAVLNTPNTKGVVLETFGSGNAPTDQWFIEALEDAIERGLIIINVSQCLGGFVLQGRYATSTHLEEIGVISGKDITTEAAIAKLMFLLSKPLTRKEVEDLLLQPIRGEIS